MIQTNYEVVFFSEVVEIHGVKTETNAYYRISTSEKKKLSCQAVICYNQ